jgi:hypothetical protein
MSCGCRCHVHPSAGCDQAHDKGSSGVPGKWSCSPCDRGETGARCRICKAATDAFLCETHTDELELAIAELPALAQALSIRKAETEWLDPEVDLEARLRSTGGRITLPATVMPVDLDATDHARRLWTTAADWARRVVGLTGDDPFTPREGPAHPACRHASCKRIRDSRTPVTLIRIVGWLLTHVDALRTNPAGPDAYRAFTRLRRRIERAVDMRPPGDFIGRCGATDVHIDHRSGDHVVTPSVGICTAELYAREDETTVTCEACGAEHDTAARRREMAATVDDEWARPHTIALALSQLEHPVKPDTLRKWIERDAKLAERLAGREPPYPLILQRGVDDDGKPVYRVGDVRARVERIRAERESA